MRLKDKVALVTGAGRGIGRDIALAYAREGAQVVINDVDPATAEATAKEAAALGSKSLPVAADVAKSAEINRLVDTIIDVSTNFLPQTVRYALTARIDVNAPRSLRAVRSREEQKPRDAAGGK